MTFPAGLPTVTATTGPWLSSSGGRPLAGGIVRLLPEQPVSHEGTVVLGDPVNIVLGNAGTGSVKVPAGKYYWVTYLFGFGVPTPPARRIYLADQPTVDIDPLLHVDTPAEPPPGGGGVASVNGQTGVVVLDAEDVGAQPAGSYATTTQLAEKANLDDLAVVSQSGSYLDLSNRPPIPDSPDDIGAQPAGDYATTTAVTTASTADRARANHTGVQSSATISDLTEAVQDIVGAFFGAGTGAAVSYDDAANTITVTATGTTDPEAVRDAIGAAIVGVGNISVVVNDAGDTITVSTAATVNATDAALRDRSTHTGVQPASTVTGLATVATSGAYADLSGRPVIPAAYTDDQAADAALTRLAAGTHSGITFTYDPATNTVVGTVSGTSSKLTFSALKTAPYTAQAGEIAAMNVPAGATTLTLPSQPANGTQVGFRSVGATTAVPLTILRGGTQDTIGDAGATSATEPLGSVTRIYQYVSSTKVWYPVSDVKGLTALDARYGITVQDEGSALTRRTVLNFVGAGVTVTDDSGGGRSVVTIPGGGGTAGVNWRGAWSPGSAYAINDGVIHNGSGYVATQATSTAAPFSDTFDRADGALGAPWITSGTWAIVSNAARCTTVNAVAYIPASQFGGGSDMTVTAKAMVLDAGSMVLARVTNATNWYGALIGGNAVNLYKSVAGSITYLGSSGNVGAAAGDIVSIRVTGSTIRGFRNGTQVVTATDTSHSGGGAGLRGDGTAGWDDFSAAILPPSSGSSAWSSIAQGIDTSTFVEATSAGSAMANATFFTVPLATVAAGNAALWNTTTSQYTVPSDGTYLITARVRIGDGAPTASMGSGVHTSNVDGTWFVWENTSVARYTRVYTRLSAFTAGQQLRLYVYYDGTAPAISNASLSIVRVF